MCIEKADWERVVEFHGHICPGLAKGYRVSRIALRELFEDRAKDEELVAIVENDACGVDAVQLLTGCTLGKGNLLFHDYGKQVFTFICRESKKAVRISVHAGLMRDDKEDNHELFDKIAQGRATPEEKVLFAKEKERRAGRILQMPEEEFCSIRSVEAEVPSRARIFNSVVCAYCGEGVAESRARLRDSKIACIPCTEQYTRGW